MKVTLRLDPSRLRRWHVRLAERLARRAGTQVGIAWSAGAAPLPGTIELLMTLERLIYRLPPGDEAAASKGDLARFVTDEAADLVIDFTGAPAAARSWAVSFDG